MLERLFGVQVTGIWASVQVLLIALAIGLGLYLLSKIKREGDNA